MQENIAELFGEPLDVIIFDRLEDFIDFLDEHRLKRIEILLLVPWTPIGPRSVAMISTSFSNFGPVFVSITSL